MVDPAASPDVPAASIVFPASRHCRGLRDATASPAAPRRQHGRARGRPSSARPALTPSSDSPAIAPCADAVPVLADGDATTRGSLAIELALLLHPLLRRRVVVICRMVWPSCPAQVLLLMVRPCVNRVCCCRLLALQRTFLPIQPFVLPRLGFVLAVAALAALFANGLRTHLLSSDRVVLGGSAATSRSGRAPGRSRGSGSRGWRGRPSLAPAVRPIVPQPVAASSSSLLVSRPADTSVAMDDGNVVLSLSVERAARRREISLGKRPVEDATGHVGSILPVDFSGSAPSGVLASALFAVAGPSTYVECLKAKVGLNDKVLLWAQERDTHREATDLDDIELHLLEITSNNSVLEEDVLPSVPFI